jgi:aromatic-L-amino-acid decarboxylase
MYQETLQKSTSPLALSPEKMQEIGYALIDQAATMLDSVPHGPVYQRVPYEIRKTLLTQPLPKEPMGGEAILAHYRKHIFPYPFGNTHPRFFAWVNPAPAPMGMLWKFAAAITSPSLANGDHSALYETYTVIRWLMELIGFPVPRSYPDDAGAMGILVEGGSLANFHGLAAARHWAASRDGWNDREVGMQNPHPRLIAYTSSATHSCVHKSLQLLGLGDSHEAPVDSHYRMNVNALASMIQRDRRRGESPAIVVATAGSVLTGSIDPLKDLVALCEQERMWLHVDGAMGGFGILDQRIAADYEGINEVHSIALDPHKWLNVPIDASALLVQKGQWLRETFSLIPSYLRLENGEAGFGSPLPGFAEYSVKQTQQFLAAPIGAVIRAAGYDGLAQMVMHHNDLAKYLAQLIEENAELELCAPVQTCIVCFRYIPPKRNFELSRLNALQKRIIERIQERGVVFLHHAELGERLVLRACIMHYESQQSDVEALVQEICVVGNICVQQEF